MFPLHHVPISSAVIFYKPRLNSIACSVFIRTLLRYLTLTLRHAPTCYVSRREPNELTEHYRADSLWRTALPFARVRISTLHNAIVNNSSLVVLSMRLMCLSVYIFRHLADRAGRIRTYGCSSQSAMPCLLATALFGYIFIFATLFG